MKKRKKGPFSISSMHFFARGLEEENFVFVGWDMKWMVDVFFDRRDYLSITKTVLEKIHECVRT